MLRFRGFSDYPPPLNVFYIMLPQPYRAVGLRVIVLSCQVNAVGYNTNAAAGTGRHTLFVASYRLNFSGYIDTPDPPPLFSPLPPAPPPWAGSAAPVDWWGLGCRPRRVPACANGCAPILPTGLPPGAWAGILAAMDPLEAIVRAGMAVCMVALFVLAAWIWTDRRR